MRLYSFVLFILCLCFQTNAEAQQKNDLYIVKSIRVYRQLLKDDASKQMVELKTAIPGMVYDLRYATNNNFTRSQLYPGGEYTFLRTAAVTALANVQAALNKLGYGLKIFDAYRPYSATKTMWKLVKDDRYVADPSKGSNHNRGTAVDLTVIDLKTGNELNMGTGFDNFTDTAHHDFIDLPEEVLNNRKLLRSLMEQNGFIALETEWWHYYLPDSKKYEVLDLPFSKLKPVYK